MILKERCGMIMKLAVVKSSTVIRVYLSCTVVVGAS